jgi:hydroxymethylbilane synthase
MKRTFRVATRGSQLAAAQTGQLVELLKRRNPEVSFELTIVKTTGDRVTDRPLASFRGTGVFVKELQTALLDGRADMAVHSLKDVPTERPDDLVLAAHPRRENPADVLLTRTGCLFADLPLGATIGTSSPRRMVQLKAARRDLTFADLRGNLDTRIGKLHAGGYDAIVVAAAGMNRVGRPFDPSAQLPLDICLPAVGQGTLALECRKEDAEARAVSNTVDDAAARVAVDCERSFLAAIGAGCSMPIAALARIEGDTLVMDGLIGDPESAAIVRRTVRVRIDEAVLAGERLAHAVLNECEKKGLKVVS